MTTGERITGNSRPRTKLNPKSTDGRREGRANWDEGAYKGESLGSIGTDVTPQRVFSSRTGPHCPPMCSMAWTAWRP